MDPHRLIKDQLYEGFADLAKAMASAPRLEILDLLSQGERNVEEIARQIGQSVKNTSAQLRVLRQAQLLASRKEPPYQYYRLADDGVFVFLRELQWLARRRSAEVDRTVRAYYEDPDQLEPVGVRELQDRLAEGDVVVLDVRPAEEYQAGHIPAARSIPIEELKRRLSELPRDREIVAYCRGPFCIYSVDAVGLLRRHGFRARRLAEGLPDWRRQGLPVHAGSDVD
jgi:rhodanese-related sulfurtransferase/DNA-binding HxlR family transcriptional regulator